MDKQLNVVLIVTDQQHRGTLGCYAGRAAKTPHADALAARGVRFTHAYTPTALCSPARASLLTGLYAHRHGVVTNESPLRPEAPVLGALMRAGGYQCGYAGKWHIDPTRGPTQCGFEGDEFLGYGFPASEVVEGLRFPAGCGPDNAYSRYLRAHGLETPRVVEAVFSPNPGIAHQELYALQTGTVEASVEHYVAEEMVTQIRTYADDARTGRQPFFIWGNFWGPHTPCLLPEPYYSMYKPEDVQLPANFEDTLAGKPDVQKIYDRLWSMGKLGPGGWREFVARYMGYVTLIDDQLGRVLQALEDEGIAEETVVIFTSDHGDMMGSHGLVEKGEFAYDEAYRIPLIVAHPHCTTRGAQSDAFVYLHDLMPTILDVAGQEQPAETCGHSESLLRHALDASHPGGREDVFCTFERHNMTFPFRMVATRTHKLVFNAYAGGELYDLTRDPGELTNQFGASAYQSIQRELMGRVGAHMERLSDPLLPWFRMISPAY